MFESLLLLVENFLPEEWHVHHTDISTAILNGYIDVDLFVLWDNVLYKLEKSLYRYKQSFRLCYENLTRSLRGFGSNQFSSNEHRCEMKTKTFRVIIMVYVDDLIILGSTQPGVEMGEREALFFIQEKSSCSSEVLLGCIFRPK